MNKARRMKFSGCAKHLQDLPARSRLGVVNPEPHTQSPLLQPLLYPPFHIFDLGIRSRFVSAVAARKKNTRVMHHRHASGNVPYTRAIVDQCFPFAFGIPPRYITRSDFKLERGCDSIHRLEAIVLLILAVRMQIDEAGRDDETGRKNGGS